MKRIVTSTLTLAAFAAPADAARWVLVSRPFSEQSVSIDRDSIAAQGDVRTFWSKVSDPMPKEIVQRPATDIYGMPTAAQPVTNIDGSSYQMQLSCRTKTVRISSTTPIAAGRSNPFGATNTSPYTFQPLSGAVAWAAYSALCWPNPALGLAPPPAPAFDDPTINPARTMPKHRDPWRPKS